MLLGRLKLYYCFVFLVCFTLGLKHVSFTNPLFANSRVFIELFFCITFQYDLSGKLILMSSSI